jgi:uncharacterized membrane protein
MKSHCRAVLIPLLILALSTFAKAATFHGLGLGPEPNSYASEAEAVSADGSAVAGLYSVSQGGSHSFRWTACTGMVRLYGQFGVAQDGTNAYDVSGNGAVVVGGNGPATFRWTEAGGISFLGVNLSAATVVSDDGTVILGYGRLNGPFSRQVGWMKVGNGPLTEFDFPDIININAISRDNSTVIGGNGEADKWDVPSGTYVALDDLDSSFPDSNAGDISADGNVIVGTSRKQVGNSYERHLVTWTGANNTINDRGVLDSTDGGGGFADATNQDGTVIVGSAVDRTGTPVEYAFIWDATHGIRNLQNLLTAAPPDGYGLDLTGWELFDATGISDDGKVIVGNGNYTDPNDPTQTSHEEGWIVTLYDTPTLTCGASNAVYNNASHIVSLPLSGAPGVECRSNDGTGSSNHTFVFGFTHPVSSAGTPTTSCGTVVSQGVDPNNSNLYLVQVDTTGYNQQYVTVNLPGVQSAQRPAFAQTVSPASVTAGILIGDVNGDGQVDSSDLILVKQQTLQPVGASNFREDVNADGSIDSSDLIIVKHQTLTGLP